MKTTNILRKLILRIFPKLVNEFYKLYNICLLHFFGIDIGKNPVMFNKIYFRISENGKLKIGDNFVFVSGGFINPLCRNIRGGIFIDRNAKIIIGNNSGFSSACLWAKEEINIGNGVLIGGDCIIMDTDAHNLDWRIRAGLSRDTYGNIISDTDSAQSAPIIIEDNVLVGTRSIILKGVKIGARSIIAAGSVVTKSIPADCIAGGNPCKIIRHI